MVNKNKLLGIMKEREISVPELAKHLGIGKTTLYGIFANDGEKFTINQVNIIKKVLGLSNKDIMSIFFADIVPKMEKE